MISIVKAMLVEIMTQAIKLARAKQQCVGERADYYVTLEQLDEILRSFTE